VSGFRSAYWRAARGGTAASVAARGLLRIGNGLSTGARPGKTRAEIAEQLGMDYVVPVEDEFYNDATYREIFLDEAEE
jgi:hypothetical protein